VGEIDHDQVVPRLEVARKVMLANPQETASHRHDDRAAAH
jgi:hypothetical protein